MNHEEIQKYPKLYLWIQFENLIYEATEESFALALKIYKENRELFDRNCIKRFLIIAGKKRENKEKIFDDFITQSGLVYDESFFNINEQILYYSHYLPPGLKDIYYPTDQTEESIDIWSLIRNDDVQMFSKFICDNDIDILHYNDTIDLGCDPYYPIDDELLHILDYSAYMGSINILKYLIINGLEITSMTMMWGVKGGNHEIIEFLENRSDLILSSYLYCAIEYHRNDIAMHMLNHADLLSPNYKDRCITSCSICSNSEMLFTLLKNEQFQNMFQHNLDTIFNICGNGNVLLFEYFYNEYNEKLHYDISKLNNSLIFNAIRYHSNEIVKFFIDKGLYDGQKKEIYNGEGTPLMEAFEHKNIEAINILMDHSNLKFVSPAGYRVLMAAVKFGDINYIKLLLEKGADPQDATRFVHGTTPDIQQLLDQYTKNQTK